MFVYEQVYIAERYLVPKQLKAHGLLAGKGGTNNDPLLLLTPRALQRLATSYTREAGVRQLEREVAAVCRAVAMRRVAGAAAAAAEKDDMQEGQDTSSFARVVVGPGELEEMLGPVRYESEVAVRLSLPGVVTGLAWKVSRLVGCWVVGGQADRHG